MKDDANMYSHMIQNGQLPVLEGFPQASAIELYNAISTIKYELYRKPFRNRMIFVIVIVIFAIIIQRIKKQFVVVFKLKKIKRKNLKNGL